MGGPRRWPHSTLLILQCPATTITHMQTTDAHSGGQCLQRVCPVWPLCLRTRWLPVPDAGCRTFPVDPYPLRTGVDQCAGITCQTHAPGPGTGQDPGYSLIHPIRDCRCRMVTLPDDRTRGPGYLPCLRPVLPGRAGYGAPLRGLIDWFTVLRGGPRLIDWLDYPPRTVPGGPDPGPRPRCPRPMLPGAGPVGFRPTNAIGRAHCNAAPPGFPDRTLVAPVEPGGRDGRCPDTDAHRTIARHAPLTPPPPTLTTDLYTDARAAVLFPRPRPVVTGPLLDCC